MKLLTKGLTLMSILAMGAGAVAVPNIAKPTEVKAADINYGLTNVGSSVVTIRDTAAQLYDQNGQPLGRYLPMGSAWKTETQNTLSSGSYYEVGRDEFVRASDVNYEMNDGAATGQTEETNYSGVQITASYGAAVYNSQGQPIGRTLPVGSNWKIDVQLNVGGSTYYRVGVNEYVSGSDVRVYQNSFAKPISTDITTRGDEGIIPLYNSNGQLIADRGLSPDTSWYTDQICNIGGVSYYRVATNEYVSIVDVI